MAFEANLVSLNLALANVDAIIAQITTSPKPDYSLDGKSVSWSSYLSMLLTSREKLVEAIIQAEGPTEVRVQGRT